MKIETQSKYIAALLPFVGKEETRYYLSAINIKPVKSGGIVLAATDGHVLACIHDKRGSAAAEYSLTVDENDALTRNMQHLFRISIVPEFNACNSRQREKRITMSGEACQCQLRCIVCTSTSPDANLR